MTNKAVIFRRYERMVVVWLQGWHIGYKNIFVLLAMVIPEDCRVVGCYAGMSRVFTISLTPRFHSLSPMCKIIDQTVYSHRVL